MVPDFLSEPSLRKKLPPPCSIKGLNKQARYWVQLQLKWSMAKASWKVQSARYWMHTSILFYSEFTIQRERLVRWALRAWSDNIWPNWGTGMATVSKMIKSLSRSDDRLINLTQTICRELVFIQLFHGSKFCDRFFGQVVTATKQMINYFTPVRNCLQFKM